MPSCASCGAANAASQCGGCHFAAYCGAACQRAHWPAHKLICKAIKEDAEGEAAARGGTPVRTHCDGCAAALGVVDERCKGCYFASYCGAGCQRAHWRAGHKLACKAIGEAKVARARARVDGGDARAMFMMGLFFKDGTGVAKDAREMVSWYRRSADAGAAAAQYIVGVCYAQGDGVDADALEAVRWYRRAAVAGHAAAQYFLGGCYERGTGVAADALQAAVWYERAAAAAGDPPGAPQAHAALVRLRAARQ